MEKEIILLDTGILIEYFRKKDKEKSIGALSLRSF
jgi:predicted nucleic acid-binding protein